MTGYLSICSSTVVVHTHTSEIPSSRPHNQWKIQPKHTRKPWTKWDQQHQLWMARQTVFDQRLHPQTLMDWCLSIICLFALLTLYSSHCRFNWYLWSVVIFYRSCLAPPPSNSQLFNVLLVKHWTPGNGEVQGQGWYMYPYSTLVTKWKFMFNLVTLCSLLLYIGLLLSVLCNIHLILYSLQLVAMATLSLASKVQEHNTKLGDVVNTCHRWEMFGD